MKKLLLIGTLIALMFVMAGCGEKDLEIDEAPVAQPVIGSEPEPAPEPEPEPEPVVEEPEVNETEPGDEDVVEEEGSSALKFAVITLKDLRGIPDEVTIRAGGTVMWRSEDTDFLHIIGWAHQDVKPVAMRYGDSWNYTFTEPGEIIWFSTARPQIQGKITVEE